MSETYVNGLAESTGAPRRKRGRPSKSKPEFVVVEKAAPEAPAKDESAGIAQWIGKNIFALVGLALAFGFITIPASRMQLDALTAKVDQLSVRMDKTDAAEAAKGERLARIEEKIDVLRNSPPPPAIPVTPSSPAPRRPVKKTSAPPARSWWLAGR